jgi:hypothetical protein
MAPGFEHIRREKAPVILRMILTFVFIKAMKAGPTLGRRGRYFRN